MKIEDAKLGERVEVKYKFGTPAGWMQGTITRRTEYLRGDGTVHTLIVVEVSDPQSCRMRLIHIGPDDFGSCVRVPQKADQDEVAGLKEALRVANERVTAVEAENAAFRHEKVEAELRGPHVVWVIKDLRDKLSSATERCNFLEERLAKIRESTQAIGTDLQRAFER